MAGKNPLFFHDMAETLPELRRISLHDLRDALSRGLDDFIARPSQLIFLGLIFPIVGIILARLLLGYDVVSLLFPLTAGFALVGPFAAIGLYEISRRRELGLKTSLRHAFDVWHAPSRREIALLGGLLMVIFVCWLAVAQTIYAETFSGETPASLTAFSAKILATDRGHTLILLGCGAGFIFAALVFMISVVAFPLLLDRNIGAVAAVRTSIRAVVDNPLVMAAWAAIIGVGLIIGALPFLLGLAVVMPILGHATWHLYRKIVTT